MAWFHRPKYTIIRKVEKKETKIPEGMWVKCENCSAIILKKELEENLEVCPKCNFHNRISAKKRIEILIDEGTFVSMFDEIVSKNFLNFPQYDEKIEKAQKNTGLNEAVIVGKGKINGIDTAIGVTDFNFVGGSLGSAMGEKILRIIEVSLSEKIPLILVSASGGGARMHEGIVSLMQMAKISAGLAKIYNERIPYISVLTDPTGGGVTASFAMLGDINIAEPGAFIMFAGPRVIEQTIKQKLPEGFQRAEFLVEHGMIDMIVHRKEMKNTIHKILTILTSNLNFNGKK
jgi:acetyl-CoA carboxylase carboxyl transferase subunit beta